MTESDDTIVIISDTQINNSDRETQELQSASQNLKDNFHAPQVHRVLQFTSTPNEQSDMFLSKGLDTLLATPDNEDLHTPNSQEKVISRTEDYVKLESVFQTHIDSNRCPGNRGY